MIIEIKIPSPGESISEVEIANWFVDNGDTVAKDQEIGEVESEKATLPLIAEEEGKIEILAETGQTVEVGSVVCKIDTSAQHVASEKNTVQNEPGKAEEKATTKPDETSPTEEKDVTPELKDEIKERSDIKATPLAKKMMQESGLNVDDIVKGLKKISSNDVEAVINAKQLPININEEISREQERKSLSQLRKKISERLVAVKNETAMLTTFNEVDMSAVMQMRKDYQTQFMETHGVKLGFMSFFTKAVTLALQQYPSVNSFLDKDEIVTPEYFDIGIAVQTDKGLMVPVIRNVETLSLADIEKNIIELAGKARKNRISMDELSGGTFTITNGGIFGSMLSTPILNPPQSGILGMHNIQDRPVAVNGEVVIRPMMYIALSYDHRIIDGRDSVGFLKTVKEFIENPVKMIFGNQLPESVLLGI